MSGPSHAPRAHYVSDPFAAPGALTPPNIGPIVRLLEIKKYFGSNYVLRGRAMEVYPGETSGSGGVS